MLGIIREKTQGVFAFIVVGLLIIPFALWGINSYFEGNPNPPVAEVNGVEISKDAFDSTYRGQVNRLRGRIDPKLLNTGILKDQVLSSMINEVVLTEHARDAGYALSNQQVNGLIRNRPEFQDAGKFDSARFQAILRSNGIDEVSFKREMRYIKIQDQILSGYKFSAIVTKAEIDNLIQLQSQQRKISYLLLKPAFLRNKVKVSEQEIQAHYTNSSLKYQTTDQVRIEFAVLSMDELIAKQRVDEKELRAEYDRNLQQYKTPAKRRASHILIELASDATPEEEKAANKRIQTVQNKLKKGKKFSALAKSNSDDPLTGKKGGDLGDIRPGVLPSRDLEAAIINLKAGQISAPVRSQYGLHLLKLTSITPSTTKSFASVKKELIRTIRVRRGEAEFDEMRERFEALAYENSDSLKPAAQETGLKIQSSGWLTRNGGRGVLAKQEIIRAAFSLQVRQQKMNSDLIEIGRNTLVALRLKEDRPAKNKPLSKVRAEIRSQLLKQKLQDAARNVGAELLKKARAGKALGSMASRSGASYTKPVWIKRADISIPGKLKVDAAVTQAAFAAGKPEKNKTIFGGLDLAGKGYAIYQIHQVKQQGSAKGNKKLTEETKKLLTDRRGSGYYGDQLSSLRRQAKVIKNSDQLLPSQQ